MTQPREIIQGATYFLTRRVLHRRFLLRPDATMTQFILYALAMTANRHDIQIHAFCAMSTHIHMVVSDPTGVLPRFLQAFHQLVALGTKRIRRWKGAVWDNARTSAIRLLTRQAIVEKIVYTLANPVLAGAAQHAHEWPGAKNLVTEIGMGSRTVIRPDVYFDAQNAKWPETTTLHICPPSTIEDVGAFIGEIAEEIGHIEENACIRKNARGTLATQQSAETISPLKRATSTERPIPIKPTVAVGRGNKDLAKNAKSATKSFRQAYRNAMKQWQSGNRNVSFPQGTWWMREFHHVNVDASTNNQTQIALPSLVMEQSG